MARKVLHTALVVSGWLLISVAIVLAVAGTWYGIAQSDAFYQRIDDYHAYDDEREALRNELDSLYSICYMHEDTLTPCPVQAVIDSIERTDRYAFLLAAPEPPVGFSLAGLVSVMSYVVALFPLLAGILLVILGRRKKNR